ncbi:uncharacterized protein PG998_009361 [Apiospora kogelbergensis]|uniref:uncharacterized protein n=1 Tax=Apiospora kogelbergensis TaxID=1337665 RepID=UPI00312F4C77
MNTNVSDLLRRPEPDRRSIVGPAARQNSYSSDPSELSNDDRLGFGAKIAIGICMALATVVLVIALLFLRRRRRNTRGYRRAPPISAQHTRAASEQPPQATHMFLMTPPASSSSKTTPCTPPPLRLSDRKYLPPPYAPSSRTTTPPITPDADASTTAEIYPHSAMPFARSFVGDPVAANKFTPRRERRTTATTITKSAIRHGTPSSTPSSTSIIPENAALRQSTNSNEDRMSNSKPKPLIRSPAAASPSSFSSSPSYPARPPRPFTCGPPLEIPNLVTPAGPPPTWALPQPPPPASPPYSTRSLVQSPLKPKPTPTPSRRLHSHASLPPLAPPAPALAVSSPLSPILSVSPLSSPRSVSSPVHSPLIPSTPPASTATLPPPSTSCYEPLSQDSGASRGLPSQLRDLHSNSRGSAKRDTHESWGSWSGVDNPGRARSTTNSNTDLGGQGGKKNTNDQVGGSTSVTLKKLDLEKLGGSY